MWLQGCLQGCASGSTDLCPQAMTSVKWRIDGMSSALAQHTSASSTRISLCEHYWSGACSTAPQGIQLLLELGTRYQRLSWCSQGELYLCGTGSGLWEVPFGTGAMFFSRLQSTALPSTVMLLIISLMCILQPLIKYTYM